MNQDLQGKVAFITGGGNEAGIAIARALGEAGVRIVLADDADDRLSAARSRLRDMNIDALTIRTDVADRTDMRRAAEAVVAHFGKAHILIANAERGSAGPLCEVGEAEWDQTFAVNVGGVVNLIQEFLPIVRRQNEGGHILARASVAGVVGGASSGAYTVQSSAVVAIMEALAANLPATGVGSSLMFAPPASTAPSELGPRVLQGLLANDLYIFAGGGSAEAISGYFAPLLAATPTAFGSTGAAPAGADPEKMFPVYAAVLRAKQAHNRGPGAGR